MPSRIPSLRDRIARPTSTPPTANARRSPRSPRAHAHSASVPSSMNSPKLSGWDRKGSTQRGHRDHEPGRGRLPARQAASRPIQQVTGAVAALASQNGRADASGTAPSSQMKGTWTSEARGIQWAFDGMGRTPVAGSVPPVSTKFQMNSTWKPWPAASSAPRSRNRTNRDRPGRGTTRRSGSGRPGPRGRARSGCPCRCTIATAPGPAARYERPTGSGGQGSLRWGPVRSMLRPQRPQVPVGGCAGWG